MKLNGIGDLLPFLNDLDRQRIHYRLEHERPDSIMVCLTLIGARVELDFFDDHVEFSVFKGNEWVEDDPSLLFALIAQHWGDD